MIKNEKLILPGDNYDFPNKYKVHINIRIRNWASFIMSIKLNKLFKKFLFSKLNFI